MASGISNKALLNKAKRYILADPARTDKDLLIKDALITASREIAMLGGAKPLAWNREVYDEVFTRYYAEISDISNANPGVITAESVDPDLDDNHGFTSGTHIVYLSGINGPTRLNERLFRLESIDDTTFSLKTLDGQSDINTTDYEEYDSGGVVYHAGIVLPKSTIEPSSGTASYKWTIKRVYDVLFDLKPGCTPITEEHAKVHGWMTPGPRPRKWRYQQYSYSSFAASNLDHVVFWYNFPASRYNVRVLIEKTYPNLSTWDTSTYPPHPADVQDYIWHRALANLATHAEKARRRSAGKPGEQGDNTKIEILNAKYWVAKQNDDEAEIIRYSNNLLGEQPYMSEAMEA